ncbi:hypothetical protein BBF93_05715 [Hyphomonas sp. CACIAM 19H1]|uniref:DUF6491 family protein n=1 Tax=Hyphomonas sp. CACIAM 19H1 TaxID=1873716 RepID=UPI000DEDD8C9|nr:DUF6491 family protein [Hyphomonas sp. CACIAM 19H1]AXE63769.1 hypothetical protein BBF93_05715 [Hyphomonas sp. CACIAM 19H1]
MLRSAALIFTTALLAACQSAPGTGTPQGIAAYADDPRLGAPVDRICFASSIDGFSDNKRNTVILREGRDEYMVEVFGACPDLEYAQSIGIDSTTGCLTRSDALIVGHTPGGTGMGPQRCLIKEIRKWDRKAEKPAEAAPETPAE